MLAIHVLIAARIRSSMNLNTVTPCRSTRKCAWVAPPLFAYGLTRCLARPLRGRKNVALCLAPGAVIRVHSFYSFWKHMIHDRTTSLSTASGGRLAVAAAITWTSSLLKVKVLYAHTFTDVKKLYLSIYTSTSLLKIRRWAIWIFLSHWILIG